MRRSLAGSYADVSGDALDVAYGIPAEFWVAAFARPTDATVFEDDHVAAHAGKLKRQDLLRVEHLDFFGSGRERYEAV